MTQTRNRVRYFKQPKVKRAMFSLCSLVEICQSPGQWIESVDTERRARAKQIRHPSRQESTWKW